MFIASSYNLVNKIENTPILMNNTPVLRTSKYTCLGMDIDEKLTWDAHIDSICSKVSTLIIVPLCGIPVEKHFKINYKNFKPVQLE